MPRKFVKLKTIVKGLPAQVAWVAGLSQAYYEPIPTYMKNTLELYRKRDAAPVGSAERKDYDDQIREREEVYDIYHSIKDGKIWFASHADKTFGHVYDFKLLLSEGVDAKVAVADRRLVFDYLTGIADYKGMIRPTHWLYPQLKFATREQYEKLIVDYAEEFKIESEKVGELTEAGEIIPLHTYILLINDMVCNYGHELGPGVQRLHLHTTEHHTFYKGNSVHEFREIGERLYFINSGVGKSVIPIVGDKANNLTAVTMWSVSAIVGYAKYVYRKNKVPGSLEEFIAKATDKRVASAPYRLKLLGHHTAPFNHYLVDKLINTERHELQKAELADEMAKTDIASMDQVTYVKEITAAEEARALAERITGLHDLLTTWPTEKPEGYSDAPSAAESGIFAGKEKLAAGPFGTLLPINLANGDAYAKLSETQRQSIRDHLASSMEMVLSPQQMLDIVKAYKEEVRKFLESLGHQYSTLSEIRSKLDSNPVLQSFLELELREIVDKAAPVIGDAVISEMGAGVHISHAQILANIYGEFADVYQTRAFEENGLRDTLHDDVWTEHITQDSIITALEQKKVDAVTRETAVQVEMTTAEAVYKDKPEDKEAKETYEKKKSEFEKAAEETTKISDSVKKAKEFKDNIEVIRKENKDKEVKARENFRKK